MMEANQHACRTWLLKLNQNDRMRIPKNYPRDVISIRGHGKFQPLERTHMGNYTKNRLVFGVGVNDADYVVQSRGNGDRTPCPFYNRWNSMLRRCYSTKTQSRQPTYIGCEVCGEWHSFMTFKSWMETQDWEGKQLDKDFIGDGKLYSPENCVFISQALNLLFVDSNATRGEYPLGVCWNKALSKFQANIRANGKLKHLGLFASAEDAHAAWLSAKIEIAKGFIAIETNPRIRHAIECKITKLTPYYPSTANHSR